MSPALAQQRVRPERHPGFRRHRRSYLRPLVTWLPDGGSRGGLDEPVLRPGPALANLVCYRLDRRLSALAASFGATYTRYVDDLTFSGGPELRSRRLAELVTAVVVDEGFRVNAAKPRTATAARRQAVLGAVVNVRPTRPRPERDALRALLHNCATRGWRSQVRVSDGSSPGTATPT